MQRLKVKEVKPMSKDGTLLTGEDGTKCSGFLPELKEVKVGDTVELELEVKGRFTNIKSVKVIEHAVGIAPTQPGPLAAPQPAYHGKTPDSLDKELDSKYRMTSLMCAVDLAKVGQLSTDNIPAESLKFYLWLKNPGTKGGTEPAK